MITPIRKDDPPREYGSVDCENRRDGSIITIGVDAGKGFREVRDWGKCLDVLGQDGCETAYAHNGGGWDYLSLLAWCLERGVKVDACLANRQIVCLSVTVGGVEIQLRDSMRIVSCGLDRAAREVLGQGKVKASALPETLWRTDRRLYHRYLKRDVDLVRRLVHNLDARFRELGAPGLRTTIASTSMAAWRRSLTDHVYVPDDPELRSALREAFRGGRVQVFSPGEHRGVFVYDVRSMYPAVMMDTPMPAGPYRRTRVMDLDAVAIYRVRYRQKIAGEVLAGKSGEGWFHAAELRRFRGTLECVSGYRCDVTRRDFFASYIGKLWTVRQNTEGAVNYAAKILANSLYGKFAQKGVSTSFLSCPDMETIHWHRYKGSRVSQVPDQDAVLIEEDRVVPWEHLGIAGIITAEARGRLIDGIRGFDGFRGGRVLYCDTDSIHVDADRGRGGSDLGEWKLVEGPVRAVYAGPKLYATRHDGKDSVKAKGIGRSARELTYRDILDLCHGKRNQRTYRTAPTLTEVLRGAPPCRFRKRRRTLSATS